MGDLVRQALRSWLGIDTLVLEMHVALTRLALIEETVLLRTRPRDRDVSDAGDEPASRIHRKPKGEAS